MDQLDAEILKVLQNEGRISIASLADKVTLSEAPTWRRVRKLEEEGVIEGYRATLNRRKVGLGVHAFVSVRFSLHDITLADGFAEAVQSMESVLSCSNVTGDTDYILVVTTKDLDDYEKFTLRLRAIPGVASIKSYLSLREIKPASPLPVNLGS